VNSLLGKNMGTYGFYIAGTIGFAFIAYLLILGSVRMKDRSLTNNTDWLGKYEKVVAGAMFLGGILAICSICMVLFTLLG